MTIKLLKELPDGMWAGTVKACKVMLKICATDVRQTAMQQQAMCLIWADEEINSLNEEIKELKEAMNTSFNRGYLDGLEQGHKEGPA